MTAPLPVPQELLDAYAAIVARYGSPGLRLSGYPGRFIALPARGAASPNTLPVLDAEPADFDADFHAFKGAAIERAALDGHDPGELLLIGILRFVPETDPAMPASSGRLLIRVEPSLGDTGVEGEVLLDPAGYVTLHTPPVPVRLDGGADG